MLGKVVTGKRVSLPAQSPLVSAYVRKKRTPFARANSPRECSDCLALTELTWLCKDFIWRKVGPAGRLTLHRQE